MELKQFMVEITLPPNLSPEFMDLIPEQRAVINKMMNAGKLSSYSLTTDRSRLWATFIAAQLNEVEDLLETWPLIEYMDYEVYELFFHEMATNMLPAISLN